MKRALLALVIGTILSGLAAAYAGASQPAPGKTALAER